MWKGLKVVLYCPPIRVEPICNTIVMFVRKIKIHHHPARTEDLTSQQLVYPGQTLTLASPGILVRLFKVCKVILQLVYYNWSLQLVYNWSSDDFRLIVLQASAAIAV